MASEAAAAGGWKPSKCTAGIVVSIAATFMLIWMIATAHQFATETRVGTEDHQAIRSHMALVFGIATLVIGLIYLVIGLAIVAELTLDFTYWFKQNDAEAEDNQVMKIYTEAPDRKAGSGVFVQTFATAVTMLILVWDIYYGFKMASDSSQRETNYSHLALMIGLITVAFGLIYLIIGIFAVIDSAINSVYRPQEQAKKVVINQNDRTIAGIIV
ncbi:hypothetical protein Nepgr_020002 [Nepenthes gracilis]|uniref:Uncharacterized protein n=1 Tax=Nepenthes gracilis TaxID=150966 RepID=A0AAD3SWH9_NEPGR|nr:hypothetical protein Nepgr_020002 [Nepenthes gracilis]